MNVLVLVDFICKWLVIAVFIGLILIIVLQGFMQFDAISKILNPTHFWEGERLPFA